MILKFQRYKFQYLILGMRLRVLEQHFEDGNSSLPFHKLTYVDKYKSNRNVEGFLYTMGDGSRYSIKLFVVCDSNDLSHLDNLKVGHELVVFYAYTANGNFC